MIVNDNYSLKEHNTFGINATAAHFVEYDSVDELQMFVGRRAANGDTTPLLHIGSGSNLLFLGDYAGTVESMGDVVTGRAVMEQCRKWMLAHIPDFDNIAI